MCSILEEMRECDKTKNYSYLNSLIEEAQSSANRMERHIGNVKEYQTLLNMRDELVDEMRNLYDNYMKLCKDTNVKPKELSWSAHQTIGVSHVGKEKLFKTEDKTSILSGIVCEDIGDDA
jgi:hypothetical protein